MTADYEGYPPDLDDDGYYHSVVPSMTYLGDPRHPWEVQIEPFGEVHRFKSFRTATIFLAQNGYFRVSDPTRGKPLFLRSNHA